MEKLDLLTIMGDLLSNILVALPKVLGAFAVFILGYIISKQVARVFRKFLERSKLDHYAAKLNEIDLIENLNGRFKLSAILAKIVYYILMLFFLIIAADILNMDAVTEVITRIIEFIPRLVTAFAMLLVGIFISDAIRKIVLTTCQSLSIPAAKFIASFVFYFLLVNVVISALHQAGVNTSILSQNISIILAGIALAFGIGYGFASKDVFSNMLSYYYYQGNLKNGQRITVDGATGIIEETTRNHIVLRSDANETIHIPINKVNREKIIFHS